MASYLYAVQDGNGREIVSAHVDVEGETDVAAVYDPTAGKVRLMFEDLVVEEGDFDADGVDNPRLQFLRWPSDDKLSPPLVGHEVPVQ